MKLLRIILVPLVLFIATAISRGGEPQVQQMETTATTTDLPVFRAGGHEIELRDGAFFSFLDTGVAKPELNYQLATASFGWMLNDPGHGGIFRGNSEFLIEAFGADTFKGPNRFMVGGEGIWRYNFVQPGARLVPYLELGGGGLYNDIYQNPVQHLIGGGFEFMLHGGVGVRWFVSDNWALSLEGDYRHVSNAGIYARNQGLNSFGGTFGIHWFF
jgi:hypothetical protein